MLANPHRLRKEKEFRIVFSKGKSVWNPIGLLKWKKNQHPVSRFAVVVIKKQAKSAVVRNRLRRQAREVIRLRLSQIHPGYDIILILQPKTKTITYKKLEVGILSLFQQAKLIL